MLLIFLFKINDVKKLARFYYAYIVRASKNSHSLTIERRHIMIIKARFTQDISTLNKWLAAYQATNGAVQFFTSAVFTNNSEIIGKDHEIMFFIGYVAGIGESGLESVSKV